MNNFNGCSHHPTQACKVQLETVECSIQDSGATCPVFFSKLAPSHIFEVNQPLQRLPLNLLDDVIVLCVSAIGCPDAFIHKVREVHFSLTLSFLCLDHFSLALPILKMECCLFE